MVAAETAQTSASAETLLENPNAPLVVVGQILCILVPVAVWFAPLPLEPVTKHGFAIVGFMVGVWITRAMIMRLPGSWDAFCSGRSASSGFRLRLVGLPTTLPGSYSVRCCW